MVILAGYTREMETFLTANSGLASRFPNRIEFPDYLSLIHILMCIRDRLPSGYGRYPPRSPDGPGYPEY